jgi:putative ABC transport system substrate-binding protein
MGKAIQLLREVAPSASLIAQLINPSNPAARRLLADNPEIERLVGVKLIVVEASSPDQLESAFDTAVNQSAEAINIDTDPLTFVHSAGSWLWRRAIDCQRYICSGNMCWTAGS